MTNNRQAMPAAKFTNLTPDDILREYEALLAIRRRPEWLDWLPGKMKAERHRDQYRRLQAIAALNEDALIDLLCSGRLRTKAIMELMHMGGDGASVQYERNRSWHGFMTKLRARKSELPKGVQISLDWLLETHGW